METLPEKLSIFEHADFGTYLSAYMRQRKAVSPTYSFMRLAKQIGSDSPSLLNQIAVGRRIPTPDILHKLRRPLKLNATELEYALALAQFKKAKSAAEKNFYAEKLRKFKPRNPEVVLSLDRLDLFGKWQNIVILEMIRLKDFRNDPHWIAERCGYGVSPSEVEESVALLLRLGLIERSDDGTLKSVGEHVVTPQDVPISSVRSYQKYMMTRAAEAIEEQVPSERYIAGTSITIDTAKIPEAQEFLRATREKFCEEFQSNGGSETYQFAVQFFRLTKPAVHGDQNPCS